MTLAARQAFLHHPCRLCCRLHFERRPPPQLHVQFHCFQFHMVVITSLGAVYLIPILSLAMSSLMKCLLRNLCGVSKTQCIIWRYLLVQSGENVRGGCQRTLCYQQGESARPICRFYHFISALTLQIVRNDVMTITVK